MTTVAGLVAKLDGVERVGETVAHAGAWRFDEDGAGVDALGSDHAPRATGEGEDLIGQEVAIEEALGILIASVAPRLSAEPEWGQKLESRSGDAGVCEQLLKGGECGFGRGHHLGDGEDRVDARPGAKGDGADDFLEGAAAADGVVLVRGEAVEGDAEVEAIGRGGCHFGEAVGARCVDEQAVGEDAQRSALEDKGDEGFDLRVEEGLTPGEIEFPHTEADGLVDRRSDLRRGHHWVARVVGATGDEAVFAGEIAERSRDLEPERLEVGEGQCWRRLELHGHDGSHKGWQMSKSGEHWRQEASCARANWEHGEGG